jgi:hypothetical protein
MTFKSGDSASQVVLGALTPGKESSPASSVGVDSKSEIMKDGGFTPVMSKEEKRKEKKRLKEAKARQVSERFNVIEKSSSELNCPPASISGERPSVPVQYRWIPFRQIDWHRRAFPLLGFSRFLRK